MPGALRIPASVASGFCDGPNSRAGRAGFLALSKAKPELYQARWTSMKFMRPPYRGMADFIVKFLTR